MKTKTRRKFLAKTIPVLLTALLFLTACQKPLTKAEKEEQAEENGNLFLPWLRVQHQRGKTHG